MFIGGANQFTSPMPVDSDAEIYKRFITPSSILLNEIQKDSYPNIVVIAISIRNLLAHKSTSSFEGLENNENYKVAFDGLSSAILKITNSGKKVVFVIDNPAFPDSRQCFDRRSSLSIFNELFSVRPNPNCHITLEKYEAQIEKYKIMLNEIKKLYPNSFHIFDPTSIYCETDVKKCSVYRDDRVLYQGYDHVSDYAGGLVGKSLNEFLAQLK
jgi:hypothetical protein